MLDFTGRVVLVTGATRGIGFAVADRLARLGATLVINARTIDDDLMGTFEQIRPGCCHALPGSVANSEFVHELLRTIQVRFRRLDVVVNNAGVMRSAMLGMIQREDIDDTLDTNLVGLLQIMQGAARLMFRTGGVIINISSLVGRVGAPGQVVYAASKAGVIGATLAAAKELGRQGIRVNAVAPGYIETEMTKKLGEGVKADVLSRIALRRIGKPEDVADVVVFLASDMARYVTGEVVGVDGGLVI